MPVTSREELASLCRLLPDSSADKAQILAKLKDVSGGLISKNAELVKQYSWLLTNLLDAFKPDISKALSKDVLLEIDRITEIGPSADSLLVLVEKIQTCDDSVQLNHCVQLLESFLEIDRMEDLIWEECAQTERTVIHNDMVVIIASLPERMANKLRIENRDAFLPASYIAKLTSNIVRTCLKIADDLKNDRSKNVQFLGLLIGKLCQCGHGQLFWSETFAFVGAEFEHNFVLSRVFEKILSHVPASSSEAVMVSLLRECPCYGIVYRILGDSIQKDSRITFLMTNKLLLHKHYDESRIIWNILGYISKFPKLLTETLKNLLQVWSSPNYVKHTSYQQQFYISSAIVIALAFLPKDIGDFKSFLAEKTLQGVPHYLDSGVEKVRTLGMVLAEMLTKQTSPNDAILEFEYKETDDIRTLKSLVTIPEEFCKLEKLRSVHETRNVDETVGQSQSESKISGKMAEVAIDDPDLDSDDDLEPYDVSEDKPKSQVKEPKYIRQCMEGFLVKEDPDTFEMALKLSSRIIKLNPAQAQELAEEFAMIVVHTEDQYDTDNFSVLLRDVLVALICADPKRVAERICKEFYARNYNIKQRLDILDALAQAAQNLAKLDYATTGESIGSVTKKPQYSEVTSSDGDVSNWREIVDRRIQAKTRRFASAAKEIRMTENKFGLFAGHFFYPLLNPGTVDSTLDIRGRDCVLLVRLLYTLSMVLHASVNTPIANKMGSELLDFIWLFRTHSEVSVRRGVLFAVSMVFLSVPPFILIREMEQQVSDTKYWLEHVYEDDQDTLCKEMAKQGLMLLVEALKSNTTTS